MRVLLSSRPEIDTLLLLLPSIGKANQKAGANSGEGEMGPSLDGKKCTFNYKECGFTVKEFCQFADYYKTCSKYSCLCYFCGLIYNLSKSSLLLLFLSVCLFVFVSVDLGLLLISKSLRGNFA